MNEEFLAELRLYPSVTIQQRFELAEFIGIETRNKYAITDGKGHDVAFAAEQGKGLFDVVARYFLGHWRRFDIHVFTRDRKPVVHAHHPFRWIFKRIEVRWADGTPIGAIQERFAFFSKRFDIERRGGQILFEIRSPIWRIWTFPVKRPNGTLVSKIEKNWSGLFSELLTDKDKFRIGLPPELADDERILLLVAGIFVDLQYFEKKSSGLALGD